mmetsp:Transcript_31358/g.37314  ORF Transcript_31358/g.37314 Transcript_31358/m.37314 type:complete len:102 (-) Transcript_31358:1158-1463(-)
MIEITNIITMNHNGHITKDLPNYKKGSLRVAYAVFRILGSITNKDLNSNPNPDDLSQSRTIESKSSLVLTCSKLDDERMSPILCHPLPSNNAVDPPCVLLL